MPRTLTYKDIKAGIKKAGPVPALDCEKVTLIAWLAAAGYGIGCRPSLVLYQRFRAACRGHDSFSKSRRRRYSITGQLKNTPSITTIEGAAARLKIAYPGKKNDETKRNRRELVRARLGYQWKGILSRHEAESLASKLSHFQKYAGLYVAAAIKAHNAVPSRSFVYAVKDTQDDRRSVVTLILSTPTGVVREYIPTFVDVSYHHKNKLSEIFHIGSYLRVSAKGEDGANQSTL